MRNKLFNFFTILCFTTVIFQDSKEFRFMRTIESVGHPYYKILMTLGSCKEHVLFTDQKIWPKISLNQILDIYYKCDNEHYKITRVEITLIINNTSSFAFSEEGVGKSEFSGTLYLPTHLNFVIYSITLFSCSVEKGYVTPPLFDTTVDPQHTYMPFLRDLSNGSPITNDYDR